MAEIRLSLREAAGELPPVCMRCGEQATGWYDKTLTLTPSWIYAVAIFGPLGAALAATQGASVSRRAQLRAPLCDLHRHHWRGRTAIIVGSLVLVPALLVAIGGLVTWLNAPPGGLLIPRFDFAAWGIIFFLAVWVILTIALMRGTIRPVEITDRDVTVTGVAPEFVDVVLAMDHQARRWRKRDQTRESFFADDDESPGRGFPPDAIKE